MTSAPVPDVGRLGLLTAPRGLTLVQDLLNSAAIPAFDVPDLLAEQGTATGWLEDALSRWSAQTGLARPALSLRAADLAGLRDARARLRSSLGGERGARLTARVVLRAQDGAVRYEADDEGVTGLLGLVLTELLLAQRDGSSSRLKTCANPDCGIAFYDLSRNSSRVWHDVRTCGNVTNLRASRARRRDPGQT